MWNGEGFWGYIVAYGLLIYALLRGLEWIVGHLHMHWSWS